MSDWKNDKGQAPWTVPPVNKPKYDEGDKIATKDNPVWDLVNEGTEGRNKHDPCGYWFSEVASSPTTAPVPESLYLAGMWYDQNTFIYHPSLLSMSQLGDINWVRNFYIASDEEDYGQAEYVTPVSGGIVLGGGVYDPTAYLNRLLLLKSDTSGNLIWSKIYDGVNADEIIAAVLEKSDGSLIACGSVMGGPHSQGLVMGVASDGTLQWSKILDGGTEDHCSGMWSVSDGTFMITGYTRSYASSYSDMFIMNVQGDGTLNWYKHYEINYYENGLKGMETSDGGHIVTGVDESHKILILTKITSDGTITWSKKVLVDDLFGDRGGYIAKEVSDGYVIQGYFGSQNAVLLKVDLSGNFVWCRAYSDGTANYALVGDTGSLVIDGEDINLVSLIYHPVDSTYNLLLNVVNSLGQGITNVESKIFTVQDSGLVAAAVTPSYTNGSLSEVAHTPHWDSVDLFPTVIEDTGNYRTVRISTNQTDVDFEPYYMILEG